LITADFTEEKNDELPSEIPENTVEISEESTEESETDSETQESITGIDEVAEEHEIPDTLPDSVFEIPDFDLSVPVQVAHVNHIEDDTSYLEGSDLQDPSLDEVAIEEPELEIIDFDDEKLEEPELNEFDVDLSGFDTNFPAEQEVSIPDEFPEIPLEAVDENTPEDILPPASEIFVPEEPIPGDFQDSALITEADSSDFSSSIEEEVTVSVESVIPATIELETPETQPVQSSELDAVIIPEQKAENQSMPPSVSSLPLDLKNEIKSVLSYMDQLLESLPEEKIEEFARSEHFEVYKKLFEELGIS
jgi:hypothetical protein